MIDIIFKNRVNLFIFAFAFFSLGSFYVGFFPPDEPKYVDAVLHMIKTGNYIVPYFNCHVRFDKPILYYLEMAVFLKFFAVSHFVNAGYDPFGIVEYAARLPSIISGAFTVILTYMLAIKLFNSKDVAKNSVIALLSFFFYFYLTRAVYPDASLILFELAAIYFFISKKYITGWIFTALAFLTKGPIGIVVPGFTYFLYMWIVEKSSGKKEFFSLKNGAAFIVFLSVSMPWYILMYKAYGLEFINKFLIYHNIERFTGGATQHPHSFFYYIPIIAAALYMWIGYITQLYKKINFKDRHNLFLLVWFLWIILFFSISRNKLVHYIAPAFIPLSIIFGRYLNELQNKKLIPIFVLEILLGLSASVYLYTQNMIQFIPVVSLGFIVIAFMNFCKTPNRSIFYKTISLSVVAAIFLFQFESLRSEKKIWRIMAHNKNTKLYEYRINNQSLIAYTRRCLNETRNPDIFKKSKKPFYIYTKQRYLKEIKVPYKVLFKSRDKGTKTAFLIVQ